MTRRNSSPHRELVFPGSSSRFGQAWQTKRRSLAPESGETTATPPQAGQLTSTRSSKSRQWTAGSPRGTLAATGSAGLGGEAFAAAALRFHLRVAEHETVVQALL